MAKRLLVLRLLQTFPVIVLEARDAKLLEERVRVRDANVVFAVDLASAKEDALDRPATHPADDVAPRRRSFRSVRPEIAENETADRHHNVDLVELVEVVDDDLRLLDPLGRLARLDLVLFRLAWSDHFG